MISTNSKDFNVKKIKGDFAELICQHHFELMGCSVDKMGVEALSLSFAKLNSPKASVQALKQHIQKMPDFMVVLPNSVDASLVEVKYRKNIDNDEALRLFSLELHERYKDFIEGHMPIYFYLVTNRVPYVHIMKARSFKHWEHTGGFYPALTTALDRLPFFRGNGSTASFNTVYRESVQPAIVEIMSGS